MCSTAVTTIPPHIRTLPWDAVKPSTCKDIKKVGKGTFAKCYSTTLGSMQVCVKVLTAETKFKSLFLNEAKILSELYHFNIPWLHAIVADSKQPALVMTYHSFRNESLNVHSALSKN